MLKGTTSMALTVKGMIKMAMTLKDTGGRCGGWVSLAGCDSSTMPGMQPV